jgi:signal transduction histidine kinase
VRDTGPGIAKEYLERVFEPFRQVERVTTRTKGGTGLGLSVSRKLARLMNGDLEIGKSDSNGTTFVFWLRAAQ